jgi:hypothetical protein
MVNLLDRSTKNVIEIATDGWWGPGMMSPARSDGVRSHASVRISDDLTSDLARFHA